MSNQGGARSGCAEFQKSLLPDRRNFLRAGALGATGLCLSELLRAEAATSAA